MIGNDPMRSSLWMAELKSPITKSDCFWPNHPISAWLNKIKLFNTIKPDDLGGFKTSRNPTPFRLECLDGCSSKNIEVKDRLNYPILMVGCCMICHKVENGKHFKWLFRVAKECIGYCWIHHSLFTPFIGKGSFLGLNGWFDMFEEEFLMSFD